MSIVLLGNLSDFSWMFLVSHMGSVYVPSASIMVPLSCDRFIAVGIVATLLFQLVPVLLSFPVGDTYIVVGFAG